MKSLALIWPVVVVTACGGPEPGGEDSLATTSQGLTYALPGAGTKVYSSRGLPEPVYYDLITRSVYAGPNDPKHLNARFVIERPQPGKLMAEGQIVCSKDSIRHSYVTSTQNMWEAGSRITLLARMLFKPSAAGHYKCTMRARADKMDPSQYLLYKGGSENTVLIIASPTWGERWGTDGDSRHHYRPPRPELAIVDATHLHGSNSMPLATNGTRIGDAEYVLRGHSVTIPSGPTHFTAESAIHMTTCEVDDRPPTGGCIPEAADLGGNPGPGSEVELFIRATQLYADGTPCTTDDGPTTNKRILGDTHHQKITLIKRDIPISHCRGSRRFVIKTYVERVSGNAVRIERGTVNTKDASKFTGYSQSSVYY